MLNAWFHFWFSFFHQLYFNAFAFPKTFSFIPSNNLSIYLILTFFFLDYVPFILFILQNMGTFPTLGFFFILFIFHKCEYFFDFRVLFLSITPFFNSFYPFKLLHLFGSYSYRSHLIFSFSKTLGISPIFLTAFILFSPKRKHHFNS